MRNFIIVSTDVVNLAFVCLAVYIAFHFVSKFW